MRLLTYRKISLSILICIVAGLFVFIPQILGTNAATEESGNGSAAVSKADVFTAGNGVVSITENHQLPDYSIAGNGVLVETLGSKASFKYNGTVDAETLVKNKNILSFQAISGPANANITRLEIKLLDLVDAKNSVSVVYVPALYNTNQPAKHSYARVLYRGAERGADHALPNVYLNNYGTLAGDRRFYAHRRLDDPTKAQIFRTSFDYANKAFYTDGGVNLMREVLKLDNPIHVGKGNEWDGFLSDFVGLEVHIDFDLNASGGIYVTELLGHSMSGTFNDADKTTPEMQIKIDKYYLNNMPLAAAGVPYTIPAAYGQNWYDGSILSSFEVFNASNESMSEHLSGNVFTPPQKGEYTVVYSSESSFGKTAQSSLNITVQDSLPGYHVSMQSDAVPKLYNYFVVPEAVIAGGSAKFEVIEKLKYNGKDIELDSFRTVYIDRKGILTLDLEVQGYTGPVFKKSINYYIGAETLNVQVNGMPEYAVKGLQTLLPQAVVYDQHLSSTGIVTEVYADGVKLDADRSFITDKGAGSTVEIKYIAKKSGVEKEAVFTVKVMESDKLSRYFITDTDAAATTNAEGTEVAFNKDTLIKMPFPVALSDFTLRFDIANSNISSFDIIFADYLNADITTFIRITPLSSTQSEMQINGMGEKYVINSGFGKGGYHLVIDGYYSKVYDASIMEICRFGALPSNVAKISFRVSGVKGQTSVNFIQISNQMFTSIAYNNGDRTGPVPVMEKFILGFTKIKINEYFYSEYAAAYDILSGQANVTLTVIDPNGQTIYSGSPTTKSFKGDLYGYYLLRYTSVDVKNNKAYSEHYINVVDEIPPVFDSVPQLPESVEIGTKIIFPEVFATDNVDGKTDCYIIVKEVLTYKQNVYTGSYVFDKPGTYNIIYYTADKSGNVSELTYTVYVFDK